MDYISLCLSTVLQFVTQTKHFLSLLFLLRLKQTEVFLCGGRTAQSTCPDTAPSPDTAPPPPAPSNATRSTDAPSVSHSHTLCLYASQQHDPVCQLWPGWVNGTIEDTTSSQHILQTAVLKIRLTKALLLKPFCTKWKSFCSARLKYSACCWIHLTLTLKLFSDIFIFNSLSWH